MRRAVLRYGILLGTGVVLLGALAAWPRMTRSRARELSEAGRPQLLAICEAVKPRGGACGAGARSGTDRAPDAPMSRDTSAPPRGEDVAAPALVKPLDAWGKAVRISVDGGVVKLESAGEDGEFGSEDDLVQRCPG